MISATNFTYVFIYHSYTTLAFISDHKNSSFILAVQIFQNVNLFDKQVHSPLVYYFIYKMSVLEYSILWLLCLHKCKMLKQVIGNSSTSKLKQKAVCCTSCTFLSRITLLEQQLNSHCPEYLFQRSYVPYLFKDDTNITCQ